jgi:membrane protease YdiL (CAAX protease family)
VSEESESREIVREEESPSFALESSEPIVRPIWRFVIAAIFVQAADWIALTTASNVLVRHPILQDALYRSLGVALLLAGFLFMLRTLDEKDNKDVLPALGFPRQRAVHDLLLGALISTLMIGVAVGTIAVAGGYSFQFHSTAIAWRKFAEILVLLVFGAIYEELSFRGYAFQSLTKSVGPIASIATFSIWFGAVHLMNPHSGGILSWSFVNTIAVGALFAVAYLRTRTLWMPIGMHFGWNFALGTLFGLPVSGLDYFAVLVHGKAIGPKWLTGGSYGVEASAIGAAVILLGFVPVVLLTRSLSEAGSSSQGI